MLLLPVAAKTTIKYDYLLTQLTVTTYYVLLLSTMTTYDYYLLLSMTLIIYCYYSPFRIYTITMYYHNLLSTFSIYYYYLLLILTLNFAVALYERPYESRKLYETRTRANPRENPSKHHKRRQSHDNLTPCHQWHITSDTSRKPPKNCQQPYHIILNSHHPIRPRAVLLIKPQAILFLGHHLRSRKPPLWWWC